MDAAQFSYSQRRGRKVKVMLLFACLWSLISLSCAAGRLPGSRQKHKVEKFLKRINKPSIKTIQSPDGDIIDCVHISRQPAFDHPFLKDHKIQVRPSYHPEVLYDDENSDKRWTTKSIEQRISQHWHMNDKCPQDTIPIRRTKKEDVLRASSVKSYGRKSHGSIPKPTSAAAQQNLNNNEIDMHEHAIAYVTKGSYYGVKASINVWKPNIQMPEEFSLSQIWLLSGDSPQQLNSIEAGWQVHPSLYGDNNTRFFTYWTSDAYLGTGCYNLLCSGFVQVNNEIALGASISPVSQLSKDHQYDINLLIWKDIKQGNWWMQFDNQDILGYWPSILFSKLVDSASMIQLGGEIVNLKPDGHHTSTQMGSGNFPEREFGLSAYVRNIQVVDGSYSLTDIKLPDTFTEYSSCYDVEIGSNPAWGVSFYFGGPGKNLDCP